MRATFTEDDQAIIDGLADTLRHLDDPIAAIDGGRVDRELLGRLGARLAGDGWLEITDPCSAAAQACTTLVGLAEAAGRRPVPIPYPLLETWIGVRALRDAGAGDGDVAPFERGARTLTLAVDQLGGNEVQDTTGWVPFADEADAAVLLLRDGDEADVLLADLPLAGAWEAPAIDLATPTGVAKAGSIPSRRIGRLTVPDLRRLRCLYLALQSGALVGAAQDLFTRTVGYLEEREQFGVRLSSFQALQHQAADLLVSLETARSLTYYAGWCIATEPDRMEEYVLTAKGYAGEACWGIAGSAIQLHGGIGMTWEGGLHYNLCRIAYLAMAGRNATECLAEAGRAAIDAGAVLTPVH